MVGSPDSLEGEPRGLQARDVLGERRPPQRLGERGAVRGWAGERPVESRAGMHEQRRAALLEAVEHPAQREQGLASRERAGGQREADTAAVQRVVDVVRVGPVERDRAPDPERPLDGERTGEVGLEQGRGLLARQALDADRARQAEQRTVEPVALDERSAARRLLGHTIDHVGPLAGQVEHGQAALQAHERELGTGGELLDERLAPEVLVDVRSHRTPQ